MKCWKDLCQKFSSLCGNPAAISDTPVSTTHSIHLSDGDPWGKYEYLSHTEWAAFGTVLKYRNRITNELVGIVKREPKEQLEGLPEILTKEFCILSNDHPSIIRLLEVYVKEKMIYLVFEYLDQNLESFLRSVSFDKRQQTVKVFMHQILSALSFCHQRDIVHGDLNPENLLVDGEKARIVFADFGLARADSSILWRIPPWYKAPEQLIDDSICNLTRSGLKPSSDIWSAGCLFARMVQDNPLIECASNGKADTLEEILKLFGAPKCALRELAANSPLEDLFREYETSKPQVMADLLPNLDDHGLNLISRMLCLDPTQRITAQEALRHPYFK